MNENMDLMARIRKAVRPCYGKLAQELWLTPAEFKRRRQRGEWSILDVRDPEERAVSIIPGALGREAFESQAEAHRPRNLLVYCTVGCWSGDYSQRLLKKGFKVHNLWGGVLAWAASQGEFVTPDGQETREVHISDMSRDLLRPGYVAAN